MKFKFQLGTKAYFGTDCIRNNKKEIADSGKRCMIVTGRTSGKASGALDDVINVLDELSISYCVFDRVENNPSPENVEEGGRMAREFKADFVIGIGGGSPLDASKAVAVLAVNDIEPMELYKNSFPNPPLPIIAIPTTAGTGSEVTPYSILTRKDLETKMSFGNEQTFPKIAFLDARYTASMSRDTTADTAVDALSHAVEGYLTKRSTPLSDAIALEAISIFGRCTDKLLNNKFDMEMREKLLYASMLAGIVISQTGTSIVHGMGYQLTYFRNVPHGRANGLLMTEYLRFNYDSLPEKIDNILKALNLKGLGEFGDVMDSLVRNDINLSEDDVVKFTRNVENHKSIGYNIKPVKYDDILQIYKKSLYKGKGTLLKL